MKIINSHIASALPRTARRRVAEPSHGAMALEAIRRELDEVRHRLDEGEDEVLRLREQELVLLEEKYRVYGRKYSRFYKKL